MKYVVCFFLSLFSAQCFSQNWQPILVGEKHNFEQPLPQILDVVSFRQQMFNGIGCGFLSEHPLKSIINTVWIDNIYPQNSDTFYVFNKKYEESLGVWGEEIYVPASHFVGDTMIKRSNGNFEFKSSNKHHFLRPMSQLLETWVWDTVGNINATVIHISDTTIFGIMDSTKTILLSTGDTLILSKNSGLLYTSEGENHTLVGLEMQEKGETIPNFLDIFDFENNLTIKMHSEYFTADEGAWMSMKKQTKYYNKQIISSNEIAYTTEETIDQILYSPWFGGTNRYISKNVVDNIIFDTISNGIIPYSHEKDSNQYNINYRNLIGNIVKYTRQVIAIGDTLYPEGDVVKYYDTRTAIPIYWHLPFESYFSSCIVGYTFNGDTIGDIWSEEDIIGLTVATQEQIENIWAYFKLSDIKKCKLTSNKFFNQMPLVAMKSTSQV